MAAWVSDVLVQSVYKLTWIKVLTYSIIADFQTNDFFISKGECPGDESWIVCSSEGQNSSVNQLVTEHERSGISSRTLPYKRNNKTVSTVKLKSIITRNYKTCKRKHVDAAEWKINQI